MIKRNKFLICICAALLLITACVDKTESTSLDTDTQIHTETEEHADSVEENAFAITISGLCGEEIVATDVVAELGDDVLANLDYSIYTYERFGYFSPANGRVLYKYDSILFEETGEAEGSRLPLDYQRIDIGDELRGLKLEQASGMLFVEKDDGEVSLRQQELYFSGSIELDGFIYICKGDEAYLVKDEIIFLPADYEWEGLPYNEKQSGSSYWGDSFFWSGNAPILHLGLLSDYDFFEIPAGVQDVNEATVTINNLVLRDCNTDMFFGAGYYISSAAIDSIQFK